MTICIFFNFLLCHYSYKNFSRVNGDDGCCFFELGILLILQLDAGGEKIIFL